MAPGETLASLFEHLGLVGGFLLTAWPDLDRDTANTKEA
jgi:hypothetical protein